MSELKSAREIALERIAKMTAARDADPEAKIRWQYEPKGQEFANKFLDDERYNNFLADLAALDNEEGREIARKAMSAVFINNISLCDTLSEKRRVERALNGLKELKDDKEGFDGVVEELMQLYQHYFGEGQQQKKQLQQNLLASYIQHLKQRYESEGLVYDPATHKAEEDPEFQNQLRHYLNEIDSSYKNGINDIKQRLSSLN